ncbi:MAG: hypothetical protein LQ352_008345 [Teloschistes flavicans]|nr:MAG: hypothetical protein LQ352_008345 [Teloschistes flavicans]
MYPTSITTLFALLPLVFTLPTESPERNLLPRGPGETCSNGINNGKQLADTTYPGSFNPSTCPDLSGPNPWDAPLVGHDKRSLSAPPPPTAPLSKRDPTCQIIARQIFDHYIPDNHRVANTQQVRLFPGLGYVFSISTCALVDRIKLYLNTGNGHFQVTQNVSPNDGTRDAISFVVPQTGDYHFEVTFHENIFQDGALRLYQIDPNHL